jgi:hypothetical protein
MRGKSGRNRFLWDVQWLVLKAELDWDRWGFVHDNLARLQRYFDQRPIWVRAYRIWRLVHQVAAFTGHPDLVRARDMWHSRLARLDRGELSDREASSDMLSRFDMGLTAGELKRIRRRIVGTKPGWKWNPTAVEKVKQLDARLGRPKTY